MQPETKNFQTQTPQQTAAEIMDRFKNFNLDGRRAISKLFVLELLDILAQCRDKDKVLEAITHYGAVGELIEKM